ncbi:hypothetical protein XACN24_15185 [Xanthomonas albilineans]|uniref:Hypothetical secreted protein n=1 Tax=Xanthomonas albilineans (strain GPE PC73 / CFBP 7063) TaxID=380358 RepID=D2UGP7_XANAP|nr:hypothetical protein [Xanthomonas albilineans]QHQ29818.1 putative secreted protein [Xanthomonas albilineans]CBA17558.1 hypothetical secreted protein [Xanthomonas albilineans GPE PC73]
MHSMVRALVLVVLLSCVGTVVAGSRAQQRKLDDLQTAYAAAIRWSEFESAWQAVDPSYRQAHPLTDLQLERYRQIQISSYRVGATTAGDGQVQREIELGVINRNTQVERSVRYRERWRWDAEAKTWWLQDGLPDLWNGQ